MTSTGPRAALILALAILPSAGAGEAPVSVYDRLKEATREHSPELAGARAELEQRGAQVHTSIAHWLPRLELQFSQTKSRDYSLLVSGQLPAGFGPFTPPEISLAGWRVLGTLPLYRRSVHLGVVQAAREREAADARLNSRTEELDFRLRGLFGAYLLQSYKLAALKHSLEIAETNLREVRARFALGQRTRVDVLRYEANGTQLESRRLQHEQQLSADWSSLVDYTGLDDHKLEEIGVRAVAGSEERLDSAIEEFAAVDPAWSRVAGWVGSDDAAALSRRLEERCPLVRSILAEDAVADAKSGLLSAQEWPELSVQASLFQQARAWGELFSGRQVSYSLGVVLSIPLYLGGSLYSATREAISARQVATVRRERELLRVRSDVRGEILQARSLRQAVEALRLARDQQGEIVRLSAKSYELGRLPLVELLASSNALLEAKIEYAKARIDLGVLVRRLAFHLGAENPS